MEDIAAVRDRHESELMAIDGVVGVALGRNEIGDDAILVYLRDPSVRERLPRTLEDVPVQTEVTGPIDAY